MHRNLKVALGGAALTAGVVVGLPTAAFAGSVDCTNAEIAAPVRRSLRPAPGAVGDNVTSPVPAAASVAARPAAARSAPAVAESAACPSPVTRSS
jgi:hypothetical protein